MAGTRQENGKTPAPAVEAGDRAAGLGVTPADEVRIVVAPIGIVFVKSQYLPSLLRAVRVAKYKRSLEKYGVVTAWYRIFPPYTKSPVVEKSRVFSIEEFKNFVKEHLNRVRKLREETVMKVMERIENFAKEAAEREVIVPKKRRLPLVFWSDLPRYIRRHACLGPAELVLETKNYYAYQGEDGKYLFLRKVTEEELLGLLDELDIASVYKVLENVKNLERELAELRGYSEERRMIAKTAMEHLSRVLALLKLLR